MNEEAKVETLNQICLDLCSDFFECLKKTVSKDPTLFCPRPYREREEVQRLASNLAVVIEVLLPPENPATLIKSKLWTVNYRTFQEVEGQFQRGPIESWTTEAESAKEAGEKFKKEHPSTSMNSGKLIEEIYEISRE